jgi:aromatic ring-opening dioxygenase catalytic subunit (LigB family)
MNVTEAMPAVFFGHGNPMNALMHNAWTDGWAAIGKEIQRPEAVLSVSRPLVSTSYFGDRDAFPTDHSRLWRFPARVVRG